MTDMPSDWHIQEAINRTPGDTSMTVARVKNENWPTLIAHARTLAEFLPAPEPVDPDVGAVRRIIEAWGGLWRRSSADEDAAAIAQYKAEIAHLRPVQDTRTDLEIAREAVAQVYEVNDCIKVARKARDGESDDTLTVKAALLAVRMARGEA